LQIDVCLLKTQLNKNFFPRTPSEKYIPGKRCPKLQEYAIRLGYNWLGENRQSGKKID
jgi:hypothetical protein